VGKAGVNGDDGTPEPAPQRGHDVSLGSLANHGWLAEQPADFRARLAPLGRWTVVERGKRLYVSGDEPDALYGLEEGLLDVAIPISADEECTIHRAKAGFWVGDGALLPDARRTLSVETAARCRFFRIPIPILRRHLAAHPGDWRYLHHLATMNATLAVRILSEVLSLPPQARVARLLMRMSEAGGDVEATHEELGRLAGMSRATFRRSLSRLISSGAVETRYGMVKIIDRGAVEQAGNPEEG